MLCRCCCPHPCHRAPSPAPPEVSLFDLPDLQSPFSIITDAAIVASTDQTGYGRKRVLASLGYGGEQAACSLLRLLWAQACWPQAQGQYLFTCGSCMYTICSLT